MLRDRWQVQCCQGCWLGALASVWLVLAVPGDCEAGKPIPVETALPIIETLEGRIRVAQWRADGISGKMLDFKNLDSIEVPPERRDYYCKWQVTFEPQSGRYRADMETVAGWKEGIAPSAASVETFSNDNRTERHYQRVLHGQKIPSSKEGTQHGDVIHPQANAFMDYYGYSSGMAFIPPFFYGQRLSDFLRERIEQKQTLAILQDEKGLWQIDTIPPKMKSAKFSDFRITYDPSRGIILGAEWIGTPDALFSANKTWARCVLQWTQADGVWVPTAHYYYNLLDHSATRLVFRDMRVNQKVDDSAFRVTFPPMTYVTDNVEKKIYRTITGIVDEEAAIRNFMETEKLRDVPPPSRSRYLLWSIISSGLLIVTFLLLWWRKRKHIAAKLLLFSLGIFASPLARAADFDKAGNWIVSHGPGESIRISQCGLNVTIFTLEYYRTAYQVKQVAASLPPNENGIRFSDIKTTLESHGLDVIAREKVTFEELKRALKPRTLAIFPIPMTERENHYLIALRDYSRGLLMIDPPVTVRPLEEAITENALAALGGVVLFVREPKDTESKLSSRVKIEPALFELGRFRDDDPMTSKPLIKDVKVTNVSDKAVMISDVFTACGCLNTKWKGGVLAAGESCDIPATILLGGWVPGQRSQRDLTLAFADGSVRRIGFVADIVSTVQPRHLRLLPDFVCIDLDNEPSAVERQIRVEFGDLKSSSPSVSYHPPWLQVDLKPAGKDEALLVLRLVPKDLPREERVTGEVRLSCSSDKPVIRLPIVVIRPMPYRLDPSIVHFTVGSMQEQAVQLIPLQKMPPPPEGLSIICAPKELRLSRSDKSDRTIQLRLSLAAPLPVGCYLVQCRLGPNRSQGSSVRLLVHVAEQVGH